MFGMQSTNREEVKKVVGVRCCFCRLPIELSGGKRSRKPDICVLEFYGSDETVTKWYCSDCWARGSAVLANVAFNDMFMPEGKKQLPCS